MDVQLINSTTSTDASEEVQEWTITNEYIFADFTRCAARKGPTYTVLKHQSVKAFTC